MKIYCIGAVVVRHEEITIKASSRKEAIEKAEQIDGPEWILIEEEPRRLTHIG